MNSSKMVYIDNIVPDVNGEMILDFSTTDAAAYGFNGGVIIEDYTDAQASGIASNSVLDSAVLSTGVRNEENLRAGRSAATSVVKMYPNPFNDYINLDFNNSSANNKVSIEVYDLSGRLSYRRMVGKLPEGGNTLRLGAAEAGMNTGVYIVTLSVNGKSIQANKIVRLAQQ